MSAASTFVRRRARSQWGLLAATLAVILVGAVPVGVTALLLTAGQDAALRTALAEAAPASVAVRSTFTPEGDRTAEALGTAQRELTALLAPVGSSQSTWARSELYAQDDATRLAYLASADDLPDHADLVTGRWPLPVQDGAWEVSLPVSTARALGLEVGDERVLHDRTPADPGVLAALRVVVVGTFTPRTDPQTWDRDLLDGRGVDLGTDGSTSLPGPTYGPWVVSPAVLLGGELDVERVSIVAQPHLAGATAAATQQVSDALPRADEALATALGDEASSVYVVSGLPATLATAQEQQRVTAAMLTVVALVGLVLAAAALTLAGHLVAVRRAAESALLASRGASAGQLGLRATGEAVLLGIVGAGLAIPLSVLAYGALASRAGLAAGGAAHRIGPLAVVVLVASLLLVLGLVLPAVRAPSGDGRTQRRGLLARSGIDLVLVVLAVAAWFQLRGHHADGGTGSDLVLVVAPMLALLAGATVALRVLPWVARGAEVVATRGRGITAALAAWHVARRPAGAAFLVVLAAASATFGVASSATWAASQADQADLGVGTDVSVALGDRADPFLGDDLTSAIADPGAVVSPITDRAVAVGGWLGSDGVLPRVLAVDTSRSDDLLRGRGPGDRAWSDVTDGLATEDVDQGAPVAVASDGLHVSLAGTSSNPGVAADLTALPSVMLADDHGDMVALAGAPFALDGQQHGLVLPVPAGSHVRIVGVDLRFALDEAARLGPGSRSEVRVEVTLPSSIGSPVMDAWTSAAGTGPVEGQIVSSTISTSTTGSRTILVGGAVLALDWLYSTPADLVLRGFPVADAVPAVVTRSVADAIGTNVGDDLVTDVGAAKVRLHVIGFAPYLPSIPRGPAVLVDHTALARAVLAQGETTALTTGWWAGGGLTAADADAVRALGIGAVTTRVEVTADLTDGPLRAGVPAALALLVLTALAAVLVGTALHTSAVVGARGLEAARLRGLGMSRRAVWSALVAERLVTDTVSVAAGAAVGAVLAWTVAPLLIVSAAGDAPVPDAVTVWPWGVELVVVAVFVAVCTAVVAPVAHRLVGRAGAAHLRMDGPA